MKTLFTAIGIILSLISLAQNKTTDSSATCVAYWNKGDHKVFKITRTKESMSQGKPKSKSNTTYEAHVQVIDSSAEGYSLQWQFKNFNDKNDPSASMAGMIMEKLRINYTTSATGAFKELTNWKEVRDFYISLMNVSLRDQKNNDTAQAIKDKVLTMFQTKEQVEALMIREVQLFHAPYGFEFQKGETRSTTNLDNPFGGSPFPAMQSIRVPGIDKAKNTFSLILETQIDKGSITELGVDVMKKLLPFPAISEQEIKDAFAGLQMQETNEFQIIISTGWLSKVYNVKRVQNGDTSQTETCLIEEL